MIKFRICRFCAKHAPDHELVKYGVRHYAHPECFLDAGHDIAELPTWRIGAFPYFILKKRGLADYAAKLWEKGRK